MLAINLRNNMPAHQHDPVRVLAVADTDSYLKWSLATLARWPMSWRTTQMVIDNPLRPSATQIGAAGGAGVAVLGRAALVRRIRVEQPDVVLLACSGPVAAALIGAPVLRGPGRPVLVTGLPGISIPASRRAVELRAGCDLFLLHSHREIAGYRGLAAELFCTGFETPEFGLATLPFLRSPVAEAARPDRGRHVVFAAQAQVPPHRRQREQILLALADLASTGQAAAVVKLRSEDAELQTHRETWAYPALLAALVETGRLAPGAVSFRSGSMSEALDGAVGLVTVSSTAALEAVAANVPIMIISDFGVNEAMINIVFTGSGCLGTLADLRSGRFAHPHSDWSTANYLHPPADNDDLIQLRSLIKRRWAGELSTRSPTGHSGWPAVRRRLRLLLPAAGRTAARLSARWPTRPNPSGCLRST